MGCPEPALSMCAMKQHVGQHLEPSYTFIPHLITPPGASVHYGFSIWCHQAKLAIVSVPDIQTNAS
eukprot:1137818-Pelagomonas_calceolata.AAC.3